MQGNLLNVIGFVIATSFAGFNIIIACDRKDILGEAELAALSYLFGIGAISLELFFMGILGLKFVTAHILLPWVLLAIINIPRFKARFRHNAGAAKLRTDREAVILPLVPIFAKIAAVLLIFILMNVFLMSLTRPVESYDAVAIWSLKAKLIYAAHTIPDNFFNVVDKNYPGSHPDYPLLVPLSQVWFYTFINNFNDSLVKAMFPLNLAAFLMVFFIFLKKAGLPASLAIIFTFFLAAIRQFTNYATNGYADLPLAVYASLTFLSLYIWVKTRANTYFWISLFSCVFAMWTKNEGAVVFLAFALMVIMYLMSSSERQIKTLIPCGLSLALLAGLFVSWTVFKNIAGVRNDVVNMQSIIGFSPADVFKRMWAIFYEYQRQAFGIKYWNLAWIALIAAIIWFRKFFSGERKYVTLPLTFILASYTAVYFITPNDLGWQLRTTASRLLIHIVPLAIFYLALETENVLSHDRKEA